MNWFSLVAAPNNVIRTDYVKGKIDNAQQNRRSLDDKEEMINHIISKCSKLAQRKYKAILSGKGDPLGIVQEV